MDYLFNYNRSEEPSNHTYWSEVICNTFLKVNCIPQSLHCATGFLDKYSCNQIDLIDVFSPAMTYERTKQLVKENNEDHYQLVLATDGHGTITQNEKYAQFNTGDLVLYSASMPSSISYPENSKSITLKIPKQILLSRINIKEENIKIHIDGHSSLGKILSNFILEILSLSKDSKKPVNPILLNSLLDIVSVGFDDSTLVYYKNNKHKLIQQIKDFIIKNLENPSLHIAEIAYNNNISVRTLNRVFAAEGTTAVKWLWEQRLATSYRYLNEGKVRQVSEAALNCGFNDLSHFSKLFKKTYGISPNQLLRFDIFKQ